MTDCFLGTICKILKFVMQNRGLKGGRYRSLTDREIKKIRDAAVTILWKTGFEVDDSRFYYAISNTTKHVQSGVHSLDGIRNVIEMCELIADGEKALRKRPIVSFITSRMIRPLRFNSLVTSFLIEI